MDSPEQRATRAQNIRTVWEALLAPNWTKDDLIDLGKAIFARTPLKRFDQAKFNRILPHLSKLAEVLEANIVPLFPSGPTGLAGPGPCPTEPTGPTNPASKLNLMEADDSHLGHGATGPTTSPDSRPHHREK